MKSSFIPSKKISFALIDSRASKNIVQSLNKLNIKIIKTIKCNETYDAISYHPDICVIKLNNNDILVAPNVYDYYKENLTPLGFNVIKGNLSIENKYPHNVQYNVAILGNKVIHNFKYTDNILLDYCEHEFKKENRLLLCTDGLTNYVEPEQIAELSNQFDIETFAENLVSLAKKGGGGDNITVAIIEN